MVGTLALPNPSVMGILNVTPDSFSDGGRFVSLDSIREQVATMARDGAAIIDIGGESTRPGAASVDAQQELDRVIPAIEAVLQEIDLPISVDTSKAIVMREATAAGASMINDVLALQGDGALEAASDLGVPVCLMHMLGSPRTMQDDPQYDDVSADVTEFLRIRTEASTAAGVKRDNIVVDPGFGFGKSHRHNVELLANLGRLKRLQRPILVGLSRKSTLGEITGRPVDDRVAGGVAAATVAVINGANIVRTHDVRETADALNVAVAIMEASQ